MDLSVFEQSKKMNQYHQEYRKARELAKILEYNDYRNFLNVVDKAKLSCLNSGYEVDEHFGDITEPQKSRNQH
jgi:DNA-damage-inducible protein D